jgi:hypothetical protein
MNERRHDFARSMKTPAGIESEEGFDAAIGGTHEEVSYA